MMVQMSKCCLKISVVLCQSIQSPLQRGSHCSVSCNSVLLCIPSVRKVSEEGFKYAGKNHQGVDIKYSLN